MGLFPPPSLSTASSRPKEAERVRKEGWMYLESGDTGSLSLDNTEFLPGPRSSLLYHEEVGV